VKSEAQLPVPLTALKAGASARLHDTRLDDETRSLLRSLGLTDASRLRVCKCGEPCIIQVRTTRIGVSSVVAGRIYVVSDVETRSSGTHAGHRAVS
jgi:Fe2+ transport system protein FeoA